MGNSIIPTINVEEMITLKSYDIGGLETTATDIMKKSFNFDFTAGDFVVKSGKVQVTEGIEALKIWIIKLIKTEKFKFKIYETGKTSEYGITLMDLIHSSYPYFFVKSEIQRELTEEILKNSAVKSVENFVFTRDKRTLNVEFMVNSVYGTTEIGVIL